ncbi:MAG: hypothetical protein M1833_001040 [Piccolia ochrophora]|nr:MAG: hypothetical protein M1833_001040 [Piccolia ochrophora]
MNSTIPSLDPILPPIRACIFDVDGLLINSEDMYTISTNTILREYGKPDLPWNIKAQLQGRPGPEAGKIFQAWAQLPISHSEFMSKQAALQSKLFPTTAPLPGASSLLSTLSSPTTSPRPYLALATSSTTHNFKLKTSHLSSLLAPIPVTHRIRGDDPRVAAGRGKPAPDIYQLALKTINEGIREAGNGDERPVRPEECLVFEDAVPGVEAGRRAGMQVVWVPNPGLRDEYREREAEVLAGKTGEFTGEESEVGKAEEGFLGQRVRGWPSEVDDGWAVQLESLERFPYERYGLRVGEKL